MLIGHMTCHIQEKKETPEGRRAKRMQDEEMEVEGALPGPLSLLPHFTLLLTPPFHPIHLCFHCSHQTALFPAFVLFMPSPL